VFSAVRATIQDHAVDEGRHHAYFRDFLRLLWPALGAAERRRATLLVPMLIDAFLSPDLPAIRVELSAYGLSRDEIEQVLDDVYRADLLAPQRATTARQTLRYFAELAAFTDAESIAQLDRYGLGLDDAGALGRGHGG